VINISFVKFRLNCVLQENNPNLGPFESLSIAKGDPATVEFSGVHFGYEKERPILQDLSFVAQVLSLLLIYLMILIGVVYKRGRQIALVGGSGSGKSTIFKLLFRFYELQSGRIKINGTDISKLDVQALRRLIAIIPQDTVLFNDTIGYNIGYGKPNATKDEIIEVAKKVRLFFD
jgi:ABC-type multidrug transport system fused ATPase/permease subunit